MTTLFNISGQEAAVMTLLVTQVAILIKTLVNVNTRLTLVEAKLSEIVDGRRQIEAIKTEFLNNKEVVYSSFDRFEKKLNEMNVENLKRFQELELKIKSYKNE